MRINSPHNPYEDHLINQLDSGAPLGLHEDEFALIRLKMRVREQHRLAAFNKARAKETSLNPEVNEVPL